MATEICRRPGTDCRTLAEKQEERLAELFRELSTAGQFKLLREARKIVERDQLQKR